MVSYSFYLIQPHLQPDSRHQLSSRGCAASASEPPTEETQCCPDWLGDQGSTVAAAHSASRWVLLKTQHFVTLSHSSLILSNFTQGLDEKGAQLSCWPGTRPPFGLLLFASLPYAAPALPLRADAACLQAQLHPPEQLRTLAAL